MSQLKAIEIKAYVPARDFELSKRFYEDVGFTIAWSDDFLAYVRRDGTSFLPQNFYEKPHADNFMMHMLVEDVDAWWTHIEARGIAAKYGVHTEPPSDRPWKIRDFILVDPTGVLWRIGHNISAVRG